MPQTFGTSLLAKQPVRDDGLAMAEVPAPKNDDRSNASHEYTTINSVENPEIYRKKSAEKKWPTKPRRLKEFSTFTYAALCWDVLVTLMPVIFVGQSVVSVFTGCFLDVFS